MPEAAGRAIFVAVSDRLRIQLVDATLLLPKQLLVCCIDQLNPQSMTD
jgi:hypothetical protein